MATPEIGAETGTELGTQTGQEAGADLVRLDARAVLASIQIVSQASTADLARPTPCADWTLADLLAHMTAQHNGFAAAAAKPLCCAVMCASRSASVQSAHGVGRARSAVLACDTIWMLASTARASSRTRSAPASWPV